MPKEPLTVRNLKTLECEKRLLDWFIRSRYFETWQESHLGNDLFISDPERADRIHEHAEDGGDGSTHAEIIDDWRETWSDYLRDRNGLTEVERVETAVNLAIDAVEGYHLGAGTLWQVIG